MFACPTFPKTSFLLAEVVKNLTAQRRGKKREDLMLMRANILAKASFLKQIPNLAYAFTAIDMWLKTFFAMPALDSSASKGAPPPPSTNMAKCAGGRNTGVMGKLQTHLITTFFHAMPRGQPPATIASQPSNTGAESTAATTAIKDILSPLKLGNLAS